MCTQLAENLKQIITIACTTFTLLTLPAITNAAPISLANLDWSAKGTMGAIGNTSAMSTSPTGNTQFAYVTTSGGERGVSPLNLKPDGKVGGQTNGSKSTSSSFNANSGDTLQMYFNYMSTDGRDYVDYSWARLISESGDHVAWLFASESSNSGNGNVVPGKVLKNQDQDFPTLPDEVDATVNDGNTVGFEVNSTDWAPLGDSSGTCWDSANTCGSTGWLKSQYIIGDAGVYFLEFGVMNWGDEAYQSALAIDFDGLNSAKFGSQVAAVPVPAAAWLFGSALLGFAGFRRKL